LSPFKAANATFALNVGLWFRLGRLAIFAPLSWHAAGSGAENPPNSTVQISRATSNSEQPRNASDTASLFVAHTTNLVSLNG
jgi:hypothetical protein